LLEPAGSSLKIGGLFFFEIVIVCLEIVKTIRKDKTRKNGKFQKMVVGGVGDKLRLITLANDPNPRAIV